MALKLGIVEKAQAVKESIGKQNMEGEELTKDQAEKMDAMMKAIKAIRSVGNVSQDNPTLEELSRQRAAHELVAKLAKTPVGVARERFLLEGMNAEWTSPDFPHVKKTVILYCHGGGYTCGGLGYAGILAGKLALFTGLCVLSFEYRLAPENPYPAAIDDGMKAYDYLLHQGYGAAQIILCGDSAGGNMALELVLRLKDEGRMMPKAMILMSPWTDMTVSAPSYEKYKDLDPMLTKEYVLGVRKAYAGEEADFEQPEYSPLYGELSGMPKTFIQVGSNEILRSDSERLHKKMIQAENDVKLRIYKGGWHVFQQLPVPRAAKAMEDVREFVWSLM